MRQTVGLVRETMPTPQAATAPGVEPKPALPPQAPQLPANKRAVLFERFATARKRVVLNFQAKPRVQRWLRPLAIAAAIVVLLGGIAA